MNILAQEFQRYEDKTAYMAEYENMKQKEKETVREFIMRLRKTQLRAGLIDPEDRNLRQKFLNGIIYDQIRKDPAVFKYTFEDIAQMATKLETAGTIPRSEVNAVEQRKRYGNTGNAYPHFDRKARGNNKGNTKASSSGASTSRARQQSDSAKCGNCGLQKHKDDLPCPAKDKACNNCDIVGHYARMCRRAQRKKESVNKLDEEKVEEYKIEDGKSEDWFILDGKGRMKAKN